MTSIKSNPVDLKNLLALSTNLVTQIATQVVLLPVFLKFLSSDDYAQWLKVFNYTLICNLLDLGVVTALQNRASYFKHNNRSNEIVFHLLYTVQILICNYLIFIFATYVLLYNKLLGEFNFTLFLIFTVASLIQSLSGLGEAESRMNQGAYRGLLFSNNLRILEYTGTCLGIILFHNNLVAIAALGLSLKAIWFAVEIRMFSKFYNSLKLKARPNIVAIKELINDGSGFLIGRIAEWMSIGGITFLLSFKLESKMLILFVVARTFFRFGLQISSTISQVLGYQISNLWAQNRREKILLAIKSSRRTNLQLSALISLLFLILGKNLFQILTHHKMTLSFLTILIGSIYFVILSYNQNLRTFLYFQNQGMSASIIFLVGSIICLIGLCTPFLIISLDRFFLWLILIEVLIFLATLVNLKSKFMY